MHLKHINKSSSFKSLKNKRMFNIVIIVQEINVKKLKVIQIVIKNILEQLLHKILIKVMVIVHI